MLAHAYASSSCIEACSPTSEFHVRSFTAPVSAATTTSAAIYQPIPTPYGVSSPRQADRLPRVIRVTFTAYIPWIYVPTFRMVSGFEFRGPLAQMEPPLSAGCSSDRSFAYSFLQIPPRGGHPCCSASSSHHQGLQGTFTLKSTKMPPQHLRLRLRATRHAWRTTTKPRPEGDGVRVELALKENRLPYFAATVGDFVILPLLMQLVHTRMRLEAPFTSALTACRLTFQRRRETLCACEMLLPNCGPLPQISHTCAMTSLQTLVFRAAEFTP